VKRADRFSEEETWESVPPELRENSGTTENGGNGGKTEVVFFRSSKSGKIQEKESGKYLLGIREHRGVDVFGGTRWKRKSNKAREVAGQGQSVNKPLKCLRKRAGGREPTVKRKTTGSTKKNHSLKSPRLLG